MKRLIAAACVAFTLGLSGSPASADGVPGAWFTHDVASTHLVPAKLAMGSMTHCVRALQGKAQFFIAASSDPNRVRLYIDGTLYNWKNIDEESRRKQWAERADHVGVIIIGFGSIECIRAK
jgi:hypothetical protein